MIQKRTEEHEMVLKQTFPNGTQDWVCPICSRRFILQWPPHYKRVILEEGDVNAMHSGSMGIPGGAQLKMDGAEIVKENHYEDSQGRKMPDDWLPLGLPEEEYGQPYEYDDPYLEVFSAWVDENL